MGRQVDLDIKDKCVVYIQSTYKFMDYLEKYGLLEGSHKEGFNRISIRCPFHEDYDPSCKIDLDKNIYNAFCCNHSGNLIGFISSYNTEVLGRRLGYMQVIETLLKDDPIMQLRVGAKTIYTRATVELPELQERLIRKKVSLLNTSYEPKTFLELSKFLKTKNDVQLIKLAIDLMQTGLTPLEIYRSIVNSSKPNDGNKAKDEGLSNFKKYDISEMISDD